MSDQRFRVNLLDIVTLLYHVHRGTQTDNLVGFEDCERTLKELCRELEGRTTRALIPKGAIESALWSCNTMNEADRFWSPRNEKFEQFVTRIERGASHDVIVKFDHRYNLLVEQRK